MKWKFMLILSGCLSLACPEIGQNAGIGTAAPHSKAILEIKSTDKGILFPGLTSAKRDAITNRPNGLHIYMVRWVNQVKMEQVPLLAPVVVLGRPLMEVMATRSRVRAAAYIMVALIKGTRI